MILATTKNPQHRGNGLGDGTNPYLGEELMSDVTVTDRPTATIDVLCTRDHCDRQGQMHRLDLSAYADEQEAREMVSHDIDLGGVFHVDCIGADGPWLFWTNHNEIFETEIEWWIEQANAAAKLCMDLNAKEVA